MLFDFLACSSESGVGTYVVCSSPAFCRLQICLRDIALGNQV
jgi:hypothetical protein